MIISINAEREFGKGQYTQKLQQIQNRHSSVQQTASMKLIANIQNN